MNNNSTGSNRTLKKLNEIAVLDLIRTHKSISKAELSHITELSPVSIGTITTNLLNKGYIHEVGIESPNGSRKHVLFELKPNSFYSIGIDIDINYINVVLIDITGRILYENLSVMPDSKTLENVTARIEDAIRAILERFPLGLNKLLGIGVSAPGMVNSETNEIIFAPNLKWNNVDVKSHLTSFLDVPIYIENDAKTSAICENWVGACVGEKNFICLSIKAGIGSGIFTDGKLYRGMSGSSGEIGHIMVDLNGPRCACGNYGCLEAMASTSAIVGKVKELVRQGKVASSSDIKDVDDIGIDQIIKAARDGDETVKGVLIESAGYIGIAIAYLANILNPSKVVISKDFVKYSDLVIDHIRSVVASRALKEVAANLEIITSSVGERASALGAAIIPLQKLFLGELV